MTERPKRKTATPAVGRQIKELEKRLAHLEAMLSEVRAEAGRSSGATRARLERVAEAVSERVTRARDTLGISLERLNDALITSRERVEREVGLLTRGFRAGVRAGRAAYRAKPRS
jgi:ribosome-binding protein aMBF1 (putative translation factor)